MVKGFLIGFVLAVVILYCPTQTVRGMNDLSSIEHENFILN
jgi:hypothetical protein